MRGMHHGVKVMVLVAGMGLLGLPAPPSSQAGGVSGPPSRGERRDPRLQHELRQINTLLKTARSEADGAAQAAREDWQINRYRIAVDRLRTAGEKITGLAQTYGPDHAELGRLRQEFDATKKHVETTCASIREKLLATTRAPEDAYRGKDKNKLRKMIEKAWEKRYPGDTILAVRLDSPSWKRTRNRRWNDAVHTWQYTDLSVLKGSVIVKTNRRIATIYPAYINKDMKTGALSAGVETKTGAYVVQEMLLSNFE